MMFRSRGSQFNDNIGGQLHPGNLEKSDDSGMTWTEVFAAVGDWGVQSIDGAADGRLFLCTADSFAAVASAVYYSDDDGDTWTLAYTDSTEDSPVCSDRCWTSRASRSTQQLSM